MSLQIPAPSEAIQTPSLSVKTSIGHGSAPRVLCLSPFFAPLANAEAFCGGKVALHLLQAGVDLTVLGVDYEGHRKFSRDSSPLWKPLTSITSSIAPSGGKSKLFSPPLGLRYLSPDWSRWIAAAVSTACRLHRQQPFDLVYSRGLPNFAHVTAYWITRKIQRPWIANFNDPWDLEGTHLLPENRDKRRRTLLQWISDFWLRRVMRCAELLTFPCARLRDYHLKLGTTQREPIVIPHIGQRGTPAVPTGLFQLTHSGNLGAGESTRRDSTKCLLRGLRAFLDQRPDARDRLRLVLVGPEDAATVALARELALEQSIRCTGRVSYSESLEEMAAATVCLLVEGNMTEGIFLPSKFPDYIQARKPVIALSPAKGTIADLLPRRGVTLVPVDDARAIEAAIAFHYEAFSRGEIDRLEPGKELMQRYDGAAIGCRLRDLFTEVCSQTRP
jgi:glycosyltransferase involved in cell wall biosynthesis